MSTSSRQRTHAQPAPRKTTKPRATKPRATPATSAPDLLSPKIQLTHLKRMAVVYLRQSSPRQVEKNQESAVNQRALTSRLLEWGWKEPQVLVIDEDQGRSGAHAAGRAGFQQLAADVGLGKVGIVMGYEVSRLSRNCADWHRLLELCAVFDTLIADADGVYQPRDFNDRLLLGLKGTMSEAELHSLRLRLDAGRLSKARRGELVQHLPTGYVRTPEGEVCFHPDQSIQDRIRLVFTKFLELGSASKVLWYFARHELKLPRRQTSGPHIGLVLWKSPCLSAMRSVLKNPAYAGAFAYGKRTLDPTQRVPGRRATGRLRKPRDQWLALVHDVYPAYISWPQYEQIQETIAKNWRAMAERMARRKGQDEGPSARRPLLTGLVRCGHCGKAMRLAYRGAGMAYVCVAAQEKNALPSCQYLSGVPIDQAVTEEFFRVLQPAEIDALERIEARQSEHREELLRHLRQEAQRLEYAAARAERQYNCVDPENRLIAAALEQKWEHALADWELARSQLRDAEAAVPQAVAIPPELRESFADVGRRLPELWPSLSIDARRQLLRTLVCGVNLRRDDNGMAVVRIVWKGGFVSELVVHVAVHSLRFTQREKEIASRIDELIQAAHNEGIAITDQAIAEQLDREGYHPCRGGAFTATIVLKIRCRYGVRLGLGRIRQGQLPEGYSIRELCELLGVNASWFYDRIRKGQIHIAKSPHYGCYLFPRNRETLRQLKRLQSGKLDQVSFPAGHHNG